MKGAPAGKRRELYMRLLRVRDVMRRNDRIVRKIQENKPLKTSPFDKFIVEDSQLVMDNTNYFVFHEKICFLLQFFLHEGDLYRRRISPMLLDEKHPKAPEAVSYTHLTLPTIYSV
eukprot:TRINITY_DN18203_c0_g1_i2.p1 TRINITY_DN18203_c0_g1~~TRINITY_DN18203_c0_g1_i2.p1  ORF type:complete len:116 (-),score=18.34 TRINITY_DN18203_c0_g1_i2:33-380(-)